MAHFELDTSGLSENARSLLYAAIDFGRSNTCGGPQFMTIESIHDAVGASNEIASRQFRLLIKEVSKASIFSFDFEPGAMRGWLVFESIKLSKHGLEFAICQHALIAEEPRAILDASLAQVNAALELAVAHAAGDAEAFVFQLSAALAGWMGQGMLDEHVASKSIQMLHQLHPSIVV